MISNATLTRFLPILLTVAAVIAFIIGLLVLLSSNSDKARSSMDEVANKASDVVSSVQTVPKQYKQYASGTSYHTGGRAIVGEEGPELIDLPTGSRVYTARQTQQMLNGGGGDTFILNVNMSEIDEVNKLVNTVNRLKQTRRALGT